MVAREDARVRKGGIERGFIALPGTREKRLD